MLDNCFYLLRSVLGLAVMSIHMPEDTVKGALTALTHVTLIDGTGAAPKRDMTILIDGQRIAWLSPSSEASIPSETRVIDLTGRFVIPGLIDSHVHLGTQVRDSGVMEKILHFVFMDGVTTVRDMGGSMKIVQPLALNSALDTVDRPRVYYSAIIAGPGRWFEGSFGENAASGFPMGQSPLVRRVDSSSSVRNIVSDAKQAGATAIKIYNGLDAQMVRRFAGEAHRQHLKVWSHFAVDPARPGDIIDAGVDVVSHADQFGAG